MQVQSTEAFLKQKLYNLRKALWEKHRATSTQLDVAEKYLLGASGTSLLVDYACSLHNQPTEILREKALLFVQFCGVPNDQQKEATTLVVRYMNMFLSVTNPGDSVHERVFAI